MPRRRRRKRRRVGWPSTKIREALPGSSQDSVRARVPATESAKHCRSQSASHRISEGLQSRDTSHRINSGLQKRSASHRISEALQSWLASHQNPRSIARLFAGQWPLFAACPVTCHGHIETRSFRSLFGASWGSQAGPKWTPEGSKRGESTLRCRRLAQVSPKLAPRAPGSNCGALRGFILAWFLRLQGAFSQSGSQACFRVPISLLLGLILSEFRSDFSCALLWQTRSERKPRS